MHGTFPEILRAPAVIIRPEPRRVYLDKHAEVFCLVDDTDYDWAIQWAWKFTLDKHKRKMYATRNTRRRKITTTQITVYMHKAILTDRMQLVPPSPAHHIGDHLDGESLNNTRRNLRWATTVENALNRRR